MNERPKHIPRVRTNQAAHMNSAAERYIASDRSDPFTRDRVYSHMLNGIATPMRASRCSIEQYNRDSNGKAITPMNGELDAYYDCEQYAEQREFTDSNGNTVQFNVPAFKNIARP